VHCLPNLAINQARWLAIDQHNLATLGRGLPASS
jgi:hypothetical protein